MVLPSLYRKQRRVPPMLANANVVQQSRDHGSKFPVLSLSVWPAARPHSEININTRWSSHTIKDGLY